MPKILNDYDDGGVPQTLRRVSQRRILPSSTHAVSFEDFLPVEEEESVPVEEEPVSVKKKSAPVEEAEETGPIEAILGPKKKKKRVP